MNAQVLAQDPQPSSDKLRASDKGFLNMSCAEYIELLRWTAKQRIKEEVEKIPERLSKILCGLRIDVSMFRDLVWNYKKYFGQSSCAGSPQSMSADAERNGKRWHRGQAQVRQCFA